MCPDSLNVIGKFSMYHLCQNVLHSADLIQSKTKAEKKKRKGIFIKTQSKTQSTQPSPAPSPATPNC